MNIDYNKEVWEGWTVQDFIDDLEPQLDMIVSGNAIMPSPGSREELIDLISDLQMYIKEPVLEVVEYFSSKYNLK